METSPQALDPWDLTPRPPTSWVLLWPHSRLIGTVCPSAQNLPVSWTLRCEGSRRLRGVSLEGWH